METTTFHPFEDRFSRDMRNALSSALASAIETGDNSTLTATIKDFEAMELAPHYLNYLEDRCDHYKKALESIKTGENPIKQAVILWNQGLFFEVHEVLEHAWYDAEGDEKLTLQALIRAAGVYVKLEYGYTAPAKKIAGKSWPILQDNRILLTSYFDPAALISALQNVEPKPPNLTLSIRNST
ncbi:MAG: hypothetical protein ACI8ZB_001189 [Desulforhopalus sp.]|jgi:hypothetical protein